MSSLFCCASVEAYRPQRLDHEAKFTNFMSWATYPRESAQGGNNGDNSIAGDLNPPYLVQLVRQINYGPLESKRYFMPLEVANDAFAEVSEDDLIQANFQKLNS